MKLKLNKTNQKNIRNDKKLKYLFLPDGGYDSLHGQKEPSDVWLIVLTNKVLRQGGQALFLHPQLRMNKKNQSQNVSVWLIINSRKQGSGSEAAQASTSLPLTPATRA